MDNQVKVKTKDVYFIEDVTESDRGDFAATLRAESSHMVRAHVKLSHKHTRRKIKDALLTNAPLELVLKIRVCHKTKTQYAVVEANPVKILPLGLDNASSNQGKEIENAQ
jgi:hypothetical protein